MAKVLVSLVLKSFAMRLIILNDFEFILILILLSLLICFHYSSLLIILMITMKADALEVSSYFV